MKKILIIDNDTMLVDLLKLTMDFYGLTLLHVKDPAEIESTLDANFVSVVICDVMMPGVDMILKSEEIKSKRMIPVIMIGIKELSSEERKKLFCNKVPFIRKPIDPNMLIEKVREFIQ